MHFQATQHLGAAAQVVGFGLRASDSIHSSCCTYDGIKLNLSWVPGWVGIRLAFLSDRREWVLNAWWSSHVIYNDTRRDLLR